MASLADFGLTEDDIRPAQTEAQALNLSAFGLEPADLQVPDRPTLPEIPAMPADDVPGFPDLPVRAITSQRELELLDRGTAEQPPPRRTPISEAGGQILDMAAAFNRGIIGLVDAPASVFNVAAEALGSERRASRLQDIPAVQAGTRGGFGPEGVVPEGLELGAEFLSGGLGIQGAAQAAARGLEAAGRTGTTQRVAEQLGRVQLELDARAAVGGGVASSAVNHSEILADNTVAQMLAPVLGGVAGAATGALTQQVMKRLPGQQRQTRAGEVLAAAASDPDTAVQNLMKRRIVDIGAAAQSGDVGVMTLARSLARENPVFEGRLNDQFVMAQRAIQHELDGLFTPNGRPISPTAAQDFIKQNSDELLRQLDDRANAAMEAVQNAAMLGRGKIDDIALSRQAKVELASALRDVGAQRDALWSLAGKDIEVPTAPVMAEARAIVEGANKATQFAPSTITTLELILGRRIERSETGFRISATPVPGGFRPQEAVGALMTLRSNMLAELRAEGKDAIATIQAPIWNRLQGAALEAIENAPVPAGVDESAYRVAANFTRRMHEVFDQGLLGRVLASNTKGGEAILSEKTLPTLLAGGRETQAAGGRELRTAAAMHRQAGGPAIPQSDFLQSAQGWIASQFQRQVKNAEDAANFMLENEQAIRRFPQLRNTLTEAMRAIGIQAGNLDQIKAGKAAIERSAFTKLAGMSGNKAISTILAQQDPAKFAREVRLFVGRDPDALRGMQRDIADMVLNRSAHTAQSIPRLDEKIVSGALRKVTGQLKPVIDAFYTSEMKGNLALVQREVANLDALNARAPRRVDIPRNLMTDLLARATGAELVTRLVSGSGGRPSLIAASGGARAGRELIFAIPESATKAVLEETMLNRDLLVKLLKRGIQSGTEKQEIQRALETVIRQQVGATAAEDFNRNIEALDRDAAAPTSIQQSQGIR